MRHLQHTNGHIFDALNAFSTLNALDVWHVLKLYAQDSGPRFDGQTPKDGIIVLGICDPVCMCVCPENPIGTTCVSHYFRTLTCPHAAACGPDVLPHGLPPRGAIALHLTWKPTVRRPRVPVAAVATTRHGCSIVLTTKQSSPAPPPLQQQRLFLDHAAIFVQRIHNIGCATGGIREPPGHIESPHALPSSKHVLAFQASLTLPRVKPTNTCDLHSARGFDPEVVHDLHNARLEDDIVPVLSWQTNCRRSPAHLHALSSMNPYTCARFAPANEAMV